MTVQFTAAQILDLTAAATGKPAARAASKTKAFERLARAAELKGLDPELIGSMTFDDARLTLKTGKVHENGLEMSADEPPADEAPIAEMFAGRPSILEIVADDPDHVARDAEQAEKAAKKKPGSRRGYSDDDLITVLADKNPKRSGSKAHAIFACYGSGTKVSAFIDAVVKAGFAEAGRPQRLYLDQGRGLIRWQRNPTPST